MSQVDRLLYGSNATPMVSIPTDVPMDPLMTTTGPSSTKSKSSIATTNNNNNPSTATGTTATTTTTTKKVVVDKDPNLVSGMPYNTTQQKQRLDKCEWPDRLLYATRMLFGGNNVNGFQRGTATAQRIKKQRARQIGSTKKSSTNTTTTTTPTGGVSASGGPTPGDVATAGTATAGTTTETKEKSGGWDQEEEEKLKKGTYVHSKSLFLFFLGVDKTSVWSSYLILFFSFCLFDISFPRVVVVVVVVWGVEVMNPRTVKKLKAELEASLQYCSQMHDLLRGIIMDVDKSQIPHLPPYLPPTTAGITTTPTTTMHHANLTSVMAFHPPITSLPPTVVVPPPPTLLSAKMSSTATGHHPAMPWAVKNEAAPSTTTAGLSKSGATSDPKQGTATKTTASAGNPEGSTLRKMRKKKLPMNTEPQPAIPETDSAGRRLVSKKDHNVRLFELLRFRGLKVGDFVAARTTSRDLWILAKVLREYPGIENHSLPPLEFLQLSEARRDSLFKEKVHIKDVEGDGHTFQVARNLILPLPRTYSEAADWCGRIKKGMRCYSMYPETTSLYPATVFDSTTYCRDQDDIIVVEFDGEEPDEAGVIPRYHIPARFATLIPKEFPSAQPPSTSNNSNSKKRKNSGGTGAIAGGTAPTTTKPTPVGGSNTPAKQQQQQQKDDFLNFEFDLDLDFDDMADGGGDGGFPPLGDF